MKAAAAADASHLPDACQVFLPPSACSARPLSKSIIGGSPAIVMHDRCSHSALIYSLDLFILQMPMQVKLWDVSTQQPALVATQDLQVGAVFAASFCPEAPWLLAAGGAMGTLAVWDITTNSAVMSKYGRQLSKAVAAASREQEPAAVNQQT